MSWLASIVIGVLTAIVSGLVGGTIAALAVDWYNVPSREGASGYAVVGLVLIALIVGFVVGIVASRIVGAQPDPGFLKALGIALLVMIGLIGLIGAIARLLADVPPKLGGKEMIVLVEFRWPQGQEPPAGTQQWFVELASVSSRVQRGSEEGPAWREDARLEDGYWIVPAAVNLWTSRGDRTLTLRPDSILPHGFVAPIAAWPGRKSLEWTEWYPTKKNGGPIGPTDFRFRYRLVLNGTPLRTQKFGDFEVTLNAESVGALAYSGFPRTWNTYGNYTISYRGKPLKLNGRQTGSEPAAQFDSASAVALIPGTHPALLVMVNTEQGYGEIMLLAPEGDSVRTEYVAHGPGLNYGEPLTMDQAVFDRIADRPIPNGQVDTIAFATPGLYLFGHTGILDTRTLTVRRFEIERITNLVERINPLAGSPDGKSYAMLGSHPDSQDVYLLEVVNAETGERYALPIDKRKMRWGQYEDLGPTFVAHYFSWVRDKDGNDRLTPREGVKPWAYRGRLTFDYQYQEYRVYFGTETLRSAMIDWMVQEFGGEKIPPAPDAYSHEVMIDGKKVNVTWNKDDGQVAIWMERGPDVALVSRLGNAFNVALATGKFDQYFSTDAPTASADSTE